jgi:hypothetical protein
MELVTGHSVQTPAESFKFNMTPKRKYVALLNPKDVKHHNEEGSFGYRDWEMDKEKDITGLDGGGNPSTEKPKTIHSICKIADNKLCLGKINATENGSTDSNRPSTLSSDCLTRQ